MPMVDVCVTAHHLAVDALDVGLKGLGEARAFTEPVPSGKLGEGSIETCGP